LAVFVDQIQLREAVIAFDEAGYKDRIVRDVYDDLMNLDSDDSQASEAPNPLGLPSSLREWERRMTLFAHAMLPTQVRFVRCNIS
jgi:hypothetical protein